MGKKKGGDKKKADENKPKKVAVDRTFGMKNKSGGSAQKKIQQGGLNQQKREEEKRKEQRVADRKKKKEASNAEQEFLAAFGYVAPKKKKLKPGDPGYVRPPKAGEPGFVNEDGSVVPHPPKEGEPGWVYADGSIEPDLPDILVEAMNAEEEVDEDGVVIVKTLEELIEIARHEIVSSAAAEGRELTPVNNDTFKAWKKRKLQEKKLLIKKQQKAMKKTLAEGGQAGVSGKMMFAAGYAKGTDVRVTATDGGDDSESDPEDEGEIDITALRAAAAAEKKEALGAAGEDVAIAADAAATVVDENLFAGMDLEELSDLDSDVELPEEDALEAMVKRSDDRKAAEKKAALDKAKATAEENAKVREEKLAKDRAARAAKEAAEKEAAEKAAAEAIAAAKAAKEEEERKAAELKAKKEEKSVLTVKEQIEQGLLTEANPGEAVLFAKKETKEEKKARMAAKKAAREAKKAAAAAEGN